MKYEQAVVLLWYENEIVRKTQKQIADEIGIGKTTVGNIIRHQYDSVSEKTLNKIENWKNGNDMRS